MNTLDELIRGYQDKRITRRALLAGMATLIAADTAEAAPPIGRVKSMNHVTIKVRDVQASKDFYQQLFGLPVLINQGAGVNLKIGPAFLGLYPAAEAAPSIDHFCLGIDKFDADKVLPMLLDRGIEAEIYLRGDTKELYFEDADGLTVQLQDDRYIGGVGPLGIDR